MYDLKSWLVSAMRRSAESAEPSVVGGPRPIASLRRIAGGITASISAAREAKPSVASIATSSGASGPMWRRWNWAWSSSSARVADERAGMSGMADSGDYAEADFSYAAASSSLSMSAGLAGLMRYIQAANASSFTFSGAAARSGFAATTSPAIGA